MENKCKILIMVLCSHKNINRLNAILNTWCQKINPNTQSILLLGDNELENILKTQNVSLPNGVAFFNPNNHHYKYKESYYNLPIKILNSFEFAFSKEWDFIFKCDDDTYLSIEKLSDFVQSQVDLNELEDCFYGSAVRVSSEKFNRVLPENYVKLVNSELFIYPQGGTGYLMSRSVAKKMKPFMHLLMRVAGAEDALIGLCANKAGIYLKDRPDLFYRKSQQIRNTELDILKNDANPSLGQQEKKNLNNELNLKLKQEIESALIKLKKHAFSAHWIEPKLMMKLFDEIYKKEN